MPHFRYRQGINNPKIALAVIRRSFKGYSFSSPPIELKRPYDGSEATIGIDIWDRNGEFELVVTVATTDKATLDSIRRKLSSLKNQLRGEEKIQRTWWVCQEIGPAPELIEHRNLPNEDMSILGWTFRPHQHLRQWDVPTGRNTASRIHARPHVAIRSVEALDWDDAMGLASAGTQAMAALLSLISDGVFQQWGNPLASTSRKEILQYAKQWTNAPSEAQPFVEHSANFVLTPDAALVLVEKLTGDLLRRFLNSLHTFHQGLLVISRSASLAVLAMVAAGEALAYGPGDPCPQCGQPRYQARKRYLTWFIAGLSGNEGKDARKFGEATYDEWRSKTTHRGQLLGTEARGIWRHFPVWEMVFGHDTMITEWHTLERLRSYTRRAILYWLNTQATKKEGP